MTISTVITNLKNTIAGKEKLLFEYKEATEMFGSDVINIVAMKASIQFIEVNIAELKRILADVEKCAEKDVEQSWRDNPDRSGGQFTQDEIDNANRW